MSKEVVFRLTKDGYEKLKKERDELKKKMVTEIAEKIKAARELGDLSENSEYDEAKNEQGKIDARIKEIDYILEHAEIINNEEEKEKRVTLGKKVKLKEIPTGKEYEYMIVTPQEADIFDGKISVESPVGKMLMGKKPGERISLPSVRGTKDRVELEIIDIE